MYLFPSEVVNPYGSIVHHEVKMTTMHRTVHKGQIAPNGQTRPSLLYQRKLFLCNFGDPSAD